MKKEARAQLAQLMKAEGKLVEKIGDFTEYDNNTICLTVRNIEGPDHLLGNITRVEMGIDSFIMTLPHEIRVRLYDGLRCYLTE
jgi:hypothetical protein